MRDAVDAAVHEIGAVGVGVPHRGGWLGAIGQAVEAGVRVSGIIVVILNVVGMEDGYALVVVV